MPDAYLFKSFIFFLAACSIVPLMTRFRLGSVLGYLLAGVLLGRFGLGLFENAHEIMHFAEFGVVMMLFLIGLELEPVVLWKRRHSIISVGGAQVLFSTVLLGLCGLATSFSWQTSLTVGIALSLSSTALALQVLQEKNLMGTRLGQSAFGILLFQDIAVIPTLIAMPLLSSIPNQLVTEAGALTMIPGWLHTLLILGAISFVVIAGRYGADYFFHFVAKSHLREALTAMSLALVVGTTLLMQLVGLSPALGAFVAGLVLAHSDYKHTLETNIEPFKGLLLGLFFISVGMSIDFTLLAAAPGPILGGTVGLILIKAVVLFYLSKSSAFSNLHSTFFAITLSQGGEFAFVLFQYAGTLQILNPEQNAALTLIVALSMGLTPILLFLYQFILVRRAYQSVSTELPFDELEDHNHAVIIAGYGRFGQIVGRFLTSQGVKLTILENNPDQIELLRRFGHKVYFGDLSRLELLQSAGIQKAKLLIVAVDDTETAVTIVKLATHHFPKLKVFSRARNRRHAYELLKAGVHYLRRETFDSALNVAQEALKSLGKRAFEVHRKGKEFTEHDELALHKGFAIFNQAEQEALVLQAQEELEIILRDDLAVKPARIETQ